MYYSKVNRGIAFTKPGIYSFALVLTIGMIAVATGMNGLYLFLSAGLGGFIVSGLLSEKAMKSCTVKSVAAAMTDAETPFAVSFTVENASSWFTVFALQNFFMLSRPRFRLISRVPESLASSKIARVEPKSQHVYSANCRGMPRGVHLKILALQQTTFPFGILEKFKLIEIPASLIIAPRLDTSLLEQARQLLRQKLSALDVDQEFYNHRAYQARDALKHVDWKKSAARPTAEWVVKQYRSPAAVAPLRIDASWHYALTLEQESTYELWLERLRAVLKVLEENGRYYYLDFDAGRVVLGYAECLAALAALPSYANRRQDLCLNISAHPKGAVASIYVRADTLVWADERRSARA